MTTITSAVSTPFLDAWDLSISQKKESTYNLQALGYHVAVIAVIVTAIAIPTLATFSLAFSLSPSLVLLGTTFIISFLITPVISLNSFLLTQAKDAMRLEDMVKKVKATYQKMIADKTPSPESGALCQYQKERAAGLYTQYQEAFEKAQECEKTTPEASSKLRRLRMKALDAEKTALSSKVYSLFLDTLAKYPEAFEKAVVKYGIDLSKPFFQSVKWDDRDHEKRMMDLFFSSTKESADTLISFPGLDLPSISHSEIKNIIISQNLKTSQIEPIQNNLYKAFKEKETFEEL